MILAIDTETTGLTWADRPFLATLATSDPLAPDEVMSWYYSLGAGEIATTWHYPQHYEEAMERTGPEMIQWYADQAEVIVMHNARFDVHMLSTVGVTIDTDKVHDTHVLAHLLDENRLNGLKPLMKSVLGMETDEKEVLDQWRRRIKKEQGLHSIKDVRFYMIPPEVLIPYALKDAEGTYLLWKKLYPLVARDPDLDGLFDQETELLWAALNIESAGMRVDTGFAQSEVRRLGGEKLRLEGEINQLVGIENFNPNSPMQVADVLVAAGIKVPRTPKGNASVKKEFLLDLDHPIAHLILELRTTIKMRSTYFQAMLAEVDENGVLHTHLNTLGTRSGRMSSGGTDA